MSDFSLSFEDKFFPDRISLDVRKKFIDSCLNKIENNEKNIKIKEDFIEDCKKWISDYKKDNEALRIIIKDVQNAQKNHAESCKSTREGCQGIH